MVEKETIKSHRDRLLMSQQYLADKLNVSRSTVARWELGKSNPSAINLCEMGELFGCGVDGIFLPSQYTKRENESCDSR